MIMKYLLFAVIAINISFGFSQIPDPPSGLQATAGNSFVDLNLADKRGRNGGHARVPLTATRIYRGLRRWEAVAIHCHGV